MALSAFSEFAHLVRRFVGHVTARPLRPAEQDDVRAALSPELAALFFGQSAADQRHAWQVATSVREERPGDDEAFVAALMHDVGKAGLGMGAVTRSLATVLDAARLPIPRRWRRYRHHGKYGAAALEDAGAPLLAVEFARWHPGPAPDEVDPAAWDVLARADHL